MQAQNSALSSDDLLSNRTFTIVLMLLAAVLGLTVAVYWPGLGGPLVLDDIPQLNSLIAENTRDPATLFGNYIISSSGPLGRPVSMITFIADAIVHGDNTWWWKYNNVMLHLINGLLIFGLTSQLIKASHSRASVDPAVAGLIVAGIWLLHPLQVSTVLYTVQRMTELSTLFVLAGMLCYARGRLVHEKSVVAGWTYIGLGFAVFFPLSIFSKESGVLLPVYCSLMEFVVFRFRGLPAAKKQLRIVHGLLLAGYAAAAVFVLANFSSLVLEGYSFRGFTLFERVLTQFRVISLYLLQLLIPAQGNMGFFHDDFTLSTGLLEPVTTFPALLLIVALIASAIVALRKIPLYSFGILFFFASHALESTIFGLELVFEHRNYIGTLGIVLAVLALMHKFVAKRQALVVAAAIWICAFSLVTLQRSMTWSSPVQLYEYAYHVHPDSRRLNIMFTNVHSAAGEFAKARQALSNIRPGPGAELHGLLLDCLEFKKLSAESVANLSQLTTGVVEAHTTSSLESLIRETVSGRCDVPRRLLVQGLEHLLSLRARSPIDQRSVMFGKANLQVLIGEVDAAVATLLRAQELSDVFALPTYMAADTLATAGRFDEARAMLSIALEIENSARIQRKDIAETIFAGIADHYSDSGEHEEALAVYRDAIAALPDRSRFYVAAAKLLLQQNRRADAKSLIAEMSDREFVDKVRYQLALAQVQTALDERPAVSN